MTAKAMAGLIGQTVRIKAPDTGFWYSVVIRDGKTAYGVDRLQVESVEEPGVLVWVSADRVRVTA